MELHGAKQIQVPFQFRTFHFKWMFIVLLVYAHTCVRNMAVFSGCGAFSQKQIKCVEMSKIRQFSPGFLYGLPDFSLLRYWKHWESIKPPPAIVRIVCRISSPHDSSTFLGKVVLNMIMPRFNELNMKTLKYRLNNRQDRKTSNALYKTKRSFKYYSHDRSDFFVHEYMLEVHLI